jgi:hypothetical protein
MTNVYHRVNKTRNLSVAFDMPPFFSLATVFFLLTFATRNASAQFCGCNTTTIVSSANYTIQVSDQILLVNATNQSIALYFPLVSASEGRQIIVVDDACVSQTHNIVLYATGSDLFSNRISTYYVGSNCYSLVLFGGSNRWFAIGGR